MSPPSSSQQRQQQQSPEGQGDLEAGDDAVNNVMTTRREEDERLMRQLCPAMEMAYHPTAPSSSVDWTRMTKHVTSIPVSSIQQRLQQVKMLGRLLRQNRHWIAVKIWLPCLLLSLRPSVVNVGGPGWNGDDGDGTATTMATVMEDYCAALTDNPCLQKLVLEHRKTSGKHKKHDGVEALALLQIVTRLVVAFSRNDHDGKSGRLKHLVFDHIELGASADQPGTTTIQQALQTTRLQSVVLYHCNVPFTHLILQLGGGTIIRLCILRILDDYYDCRFLNVGSTGKIGQFCLVTQVSANRTVRRPSSNSRRLSIVSYESTPTTIMVVAAPLLPLVGETSAAFVHFVTVSLSEQQQQQQHGIAATTRPSWVSRFMDGTKCSRLSSLVLVARAIVLHTVHLGCVGPL
eukprot:scaffold3946_cov177-Amphora_coffeaeformis.AAC.14